MRKMLAFIALLALMPLAASATLEELTPESAALVLDIAPDAGAPVDLLAALEAIGWEGPLETLLGMLALIDEDFALEPDGGDLWGALAEELAWSCPQLVPVVEAGDAAALFGNTLLSLHLSPFNPIPHALALSRPSDPARFAALQGGLVECFGGPQLLQDGVALNLLFDGSELPIVVANLGDTFAASTDPNLLRWVVRQHAGANQRSMADAPLGVALAALTPGGLGIAADLSAFAQLSGLLAMFVPFEFTPLLEEASAVLQTIGVVGARIAWDEAGVRAEGVQLSPDAPLAPLLGALLRHDGRAPMPPLLPEGSTALSGQYVDWSAGVAAIDQLLAVIGAAFGESLTLEGLLAELFGVDLGAALLDWAGPGVSSVTLAPVGTDLAHWLFGAPTLISIPVANRSAAAGASAALADLIAAVGGLADELMSEVGDLPAFPGGSAVRSQASVAGVSFERVRIGANIDLGIALVGDHLSIVSPFASAAAVLDAHAAGATPDRNRAWAEALGSWPNDARAVRLSDQRAELNSAAATVGSLGQPLMALLLTLASDPNLFAADPWRGDWDDWDDWDDSWWDDGSEWWFGPDRLTEPAWSDELWDIELDALPAPMSLTVGTFLEGELTTETPHLLFDLRGAEPGSVVEIVMIAYGFDLDTYLYVIDADSGRLLFENDDAPDTTTSIIAFEVEGGRNLQVIASSWFGYGTGEFFLSATVRDEDDAPTYDEGGSSTMVDPWSFVEPELELPSFAALLKLSDTLEASLRLLAERSGFASSVTRTEGGATVTRMLWPLR